MVIDIKGSKHFETVGHESKDRISSGAGLMNSSALGFAFRVANACHLSNVVDLVAQQICLITCVYVQQRLGGQALHPHPQKNNTDWTRNVLARTHAPMHALTTRIALKASDTLTSKKPASEQTCSHE